MIPKISKTAHLSENASTAYLTENIDNFHFLGFSEAEKSYINSKPEKESTCVVYRYPKFSFVYKHKSGIPAHQQNEAARKAGSKFCDLLIAEKTTRVQLSGMENAEITLAFVEGLLLTAYSFDKYKKEKDFRFEELEIVCSTLTNQQIAETVNLVQAVFKARDLVNEPLSFLTATQFSAEIEKMGEEAGFSVEVFHKQKIEALKMGGLLAVNRGSIDPPTFTILEWNPANAVNTKPVALVGKGVVFDTGGLSLKPTPKSMDYMKSDMAGAAVVAATVFALARNNIPVHVVGLVPATDNRPDGNAYVPGDIITMFDGTTVEIRNTDAEGRLILADALSYAKKYEPALVIDVATLTGAADIVAGKCASVVMGNAEEYLLKLKETGNETFERLIEVPLWEEYAEPLKSGVADLNNLGVREAQSTIAGKFLEHFTSYPWIHLDTAGTPYLDEKDHYQPAGGTGFGTRLLYNFLKKFN
ncbi:MAG: M17 family metallopeptidase [Draconibacterium sp.]